MSQNENTLMELVCRYVDDKASEEDCRELVAILESNDANLSAVADQLWVSRLLSELNRKALDPENIVRPCLPRPASCRRIRSSNAPGCNAVRRCGAG